MDRKNTKPKKLFIKKFNPKLFEKYDVPARRKIKEVLGPLVKDHPDPYAADLLLKIEGCKYKYLEVQVCASWQQHKYPYKKFTVAARKGRYGPNTLLLTLSRNLARGYLFDTSCMKPGNLRRLKKYSREFVYVLPWSQVCEIYTETLDADTIKLF